LLAQTGAGGVLSLWYELGCEEAERALPFSVGMRKEGLHTQPCLSATPLTVAFDKNQNALSPVPPKEMLLASLPVTLDGKRLGQNAH